MKKIKWGIIGTGGISSQFATALNSLETAEIVAVASRDMERAKAFAEKYHIQTAYASYEELAKALDIDVIYIGTPHTEHKENAALCIKHGKAVLCEKPFTINQQETKYLIDLAKEHNVFLMEAMWTKFLPATKAVKKWLQDKRIGEVQYINISFGFRAEFNLGSRLFNPEVAGGALLDVGVYVIAYAVHMMNKLPDRVTSNAYLGRSGIDEINAITMSYKDGAIASLSSAITVNTGDDAIIFGDKGKIIVPNFWRAEGAKLFDKDGMLVEEFMQPLTSSGLVFEAEEVNRCLREGRKESEILPLKDTLDIIKIMDGARTEWGLVYPQECR